jgi:hypothetical protein
MSGILEIDPARPLAFSLVTNTTTPLNKHRVRLAHDQLVRLLTAYLARTSKAPLPAPTAEPATDASPDEPGDAPDADEAALDAEAASAK